MGELQLAKKRNNTLEFFKLFSACLVVLGHIGLPEQISTYYNAATRYIIPFFFLSSGFFGYHTAPEKTLRGIRKMLLAYGIAIVVYNLNTIWDVVAFGGLAAVPAYYAQFCNLTTVLVYLLFNVSPSFEPLWFLLSMIYVQTIHYLVGRYRISEKICFGYTLVGLGLMLFLSEGLLLLNVKIPTFFYRNFLIMGYPLMGLGMLMRKYREWLTALPTSLLLFAIVLGLTEEILSAMYLGLGEFYLGSHVIAASLLILCLKYPNLSFADRLSPVSSLSLFVYLSHMLIYTIIKRVVLQTSIDINSGVYKTVAGFSVCLIAIGCGWLLEKIKAARKKKAPVAG